MDAAQVLTLITSILTLIGVVTTSLIDIKGLRRKVNAMDTKMDQYQDKTTRNGVKIEDLEKKVGSIGDNVDENTRRIERISAKLDLD